MGLGFRWDDNRIQAELMSVRAAIDALPTSRILIHQPLMSGLSGQATDIDIHAREILRMREITNQLLAKHTGQMLEKVERDVERDFIMNAQQAKEYGIVDDIIYKHK